MSEKRNISDLSKSFSDAVRIPKKQKDDSDPETTEMTTSTPVSQHDSFPPLPTVSNPQVGEQLLIGEGDIIRIATAVKLSIQNEIHTLVYLLLYLYLHCQNPSHVP
jgi:hypothetical protein